MKESWWLHFATMEITDLVPHCQQIKNTCLILLIMKQIVPDLKIFQTEEFYFLNNFHLCLEYYSMYKLK